MITELQKCVRRIQATRAQFACGTVSALNGTDVQINGLSHKAGLGQLLYAPSATVSGADACLEVASVQPGAIIALPAALRSDLGIGSEVMLLGHPKPPGTSGTPAMGPFGQALDTGEAAPLSTETDQPHATPVTLGFGAQISTGLCALDTLLPFADGQRLGIFAGPGVGKSTLLRDVARAANVDRVIWISVGERAREIAELRTIAQTHKNWTLIAASGEQSAPMRMRAVKTGLHLSCAFREDGARVLVVLDSLTRYAEALRDQAIAIGEALGPGGWPIRLGQSLAQLLEQIGTTQQGSSAALISVLLQGEDIEEPLADTVRGLLDGHILLDRAEAERGAFPAIDFLRSVSRSAEHLNDTPVLSLCEATRATLSEARRLRPLYDAGLITPGANPDADAAVQRAELLSTCLRGSSAHIEAARKALSQVLGHPS